MEFAGFGEHAIYRQFASDKEERRDGARLRTRQQRAQRRVAGRNAQIHVLYGQIAQQEATQSVCRQNRR